MNLVQETPLPPFKNIFWFAVIIVLTAGLSLVSIHLPLGRDEGVAAYFGWQVLQGKAVYKDLYHFNFPGIFWTYALALKIFGARPEAVNIFDLIFRLLTISGVYLAASRLFGTRTALWSMAIYGIFSTVVYNSYWLNAQKETFALGALAWCLFFLSMGLSQEGLKKFWLFMAGLSGFAAMLYKPTVALAPGFAGLYLLFSKDYSLRERGSGVFIFGLGFAALALLSGAYLHATGSFSEMVKQVFIFGVNYGGQYYKGGFKVFGLAAWKILVWAINFGFLSVCSVLGALAMRKAGARGFNLLFWFGLGLFLNILVQLKFFTYQFMVLILPLSIFAGAFFGVYFKNLFLEQDKTARAAVFLLSAFLLAANLEQDFSRYPRELLYDLKMINTDDFLEKYGKWGSGDISAAASYKAARYLKEQTERSDQVLVFSLEPGLNFLAQRSSPTRFCYDLPLTYQYGGERFKSYQADLKKEFISGLSANPPVYIVVVEKDNSNIEPMDSFEQMLGFVEFRSFLEQNYYLETKIEHYYLYKKK